MNTSFVQLLRRYDYLLPKARIALTPSSPRDSARLLIYNRRKKEINDDRFIHLASCLPPRSVLVLNQTKVIPARFTVTKPTGGKAKLLYVEMGENEIKVLSEKKLEVGAKLAASARHAFRVVRNRGSAYFLKPLFPLNKLLTFLNHYGVTPIPFYLRHTPLKESALRRKYQTVFARVPGSIAAPTASLHFTPRLIKNLETQGHSVKYITLHVSLGTFTPLTEEQTRIGKLHQEWYSIDRRTADFLTRAKAQGRPIIAVGTTVVRALESSTKTLQLSPPYQEPVPSLSRERAEEGVIRPVKTKFISLHGATNLFIREGYHFKFIDGMITNFHVPRSSLLMLVAAFVGREKLLSLYRRAMRKRYAFFSFGDGMLLY